MLSPDAVQVWPNMTWPTSMEMFGYFFKRSAICAAPDEKWRSPSVP